jgi:hypothetical protein
MQPARIKYYGLIPMTKQTYWICTVGAFSFAFAVIAIGGLLGKLPPLSSVWQSVPTNLAPGIGAFIYRYLYQILIACLVLEVIDIIMTMRQFRKKEAEQQVKLLES